MIAAFLVVCAVQEEPQSSIRESWVDTDGAATDSAARDGEVHVSLWTNRSIAQAYVLRWGGTADFICCGTPTEPGDLIVHSVDPGTLAVLAYSSTMAQCTQSSWGEYAGGDTLEWVVSNFEWETTDKGVCKSLYEG